LQSLVSLKILRFKSEAAEKNITIATKDSIGRKLAKKAGIFSIESVRAAMTQSISESETKISSPQKITHKKLKIVETISKVTQKFKKLSRDEIPLGNFAPKQGIKKIWHWISGGVISKENETNSAEFIIRAPSRKLLFGLIVAAITLLVFIIYIAVPSATIYITPRADPISKVVNINLINKENSVPTNSINPIAHKIPTEFLEFELEREIRIGATGQNFSGTNATGFITIFNRSPRDKFIIPSRFLSNNRIIFHTKKVLTIPKAINDVPGSIIAEVQACETDDQKCDCINTPEACHGNFVGERGNIAPSFFVLPAIPSLSPELYWAESTETFSGGLTRIEKFITQTDLEQAKETVIPELKKIAKAEIEKILAQKNQINAKNFVLLEKSRLLEVKILDLIVPSDLAGKKQDDFKIKVRAKVRGVAYEENDLRILLFKQLETKVHPEKILQKVNFEAVAIRVEEFDWDLQQIKLAVTIEGIEEFDLAEKNLAGSRLIKKIRERILGKNVVKAENYIRNLPEVQNAAISLWPFWARVVPELKENIGFRIPNKKP
jgi:hypothetical protein